ncbi:50S ribosomal protein L10 [candidate division WWE3 bacterium CG06_land_8_20_14_3_00_42_16]|uniref:Large ribosomal subunit protein uL10 n=4 Tax=Katanobacteria TaxID=422282 RepID=A0A2M7ALW2_UNCKA|nr:MAG: 50S ribosomal protein L10 [bacterium CG1_02_42_9]PIU68355.1 MAG: 50S ribosomal protein L10 [candidate division WWE3 bacterium CG06_land_8_20_14_3_00_42_16]PIZ43347.1 MAG: 50S ribosomal protein L10 [candidate division WWE3 bacterium CG_4_10_14_0_2_um_filter_42_8]PJA37452.1 MAG: 50S ribosomal protein L10 [candidate division WWE3 bacterium CG_4_9_14_3_um_filter_43_9]PJC68900.1 MAG: 50S ribosomal protein L10 [candidate division WWE3 bacterium CG_4_8_14_3_um_filter_42_11]
MAISKDQKVSVVQDIKDKISRANLFLLTDYRGLKVQEIEMLKKDLKSSGAEYKIVKNTLLKRAVADEISADAHFQNLEGPTAVLFCLSDEVLPLKSLFKFKKNLELPKIKFGFSKGACLDENQVQTLAYLPDRKTLVYQVVTGIGSPLFRLHTALTANLQKFANQLSQIKTQKQNLN